MRCCVCDREIPPRYHYCDRCRRLNKPRESKRRAALRAAYDPTVDAFRDHWSRLLLEERDLGDPFHLCFDHLIPVRGSELVVTSELFNQLKSQFSPDEFRCVIEELVAHRAGRPFDRHRIGFEYWRQKAPAPHGSGRHRAIDRRNGARPDKCSVCAKAPVWRSSYCSRCYRLASWQGHPRTANARALRAAWSAEEDGFLCQYTGVRLDEDDPRGPWYLSFDHPVPGDRGKLVIAAYWVNMMKNALSEDEFWAVILEYDRYSREGGEFDRDVAEFRYWRRRRRTSA